VVSRTRQVSSKLSWGPTHVDGIRHFAHGTRSALRTIKYHGQNRKTSPDKLCEADIIITTYHTLASEHANNKDVINDIEWYRLVLDEGTAVSSAPKDLADVTLAHIIRRQSTTLYRTVSGIPARARWCLTGTPIQNRLEDLGSLLTFLRLEPFHSLSTFRKFIALPYDEGSKRRTLAIERFTRLLDSVCLRRGKELLHLPDQLSIIRKITLSREERIQYDQTHKTMFRAIRHQNGVFDSKSTLGMFQVQLQLRILCNHGTWQQPFSWNRRKLHLLDEREAVEASLGREGEVTCSGCRQTMPLFGTGTQFRRYAECRHVLCSECVEESSTQGQDALPTRCPLCVPLWDASKTTHRSKQTSQEDMYFRSDGRSSKMDMLMADVLANVLTTKRYAYLPLPTAIY
jgi:SWI/SNF-related matrix-associated actin-dependent regulator of chromatin subfamily A3